ncbi:HNH endonuclease signature motif containing protein [Brenneria populi]|uniref:HNH endonuclease signature motif containing protein n=1 Tax=Brenneria populi TaxID=1505588 RepID=A0ABU6JVJ5_9GAMM|nr:HNH endonuclease signature motif containing protein [Brenneria populi Li et al. 2015]
MEKQQNTGWSDEELTASVEAYVEMKQLHQAGRPFTKKAYYESLAARFPRTAKSFELRMQNISFAYLDMGRDWLTGLKPAKNVGANMLPRLKALIEAIDPIGELTEKQFEAQVSRLRKKGVKDKPKGNRKPPKQTTQTTSFVRDPEVKAYVLEEAKGVCECCRNPAPFMQADGFPFLEVHHLKYLANGGSDTSENAAALCPNCHRAMHYAVNKDTLLEKLYLTIPRLVRE